MRVKGLQHPPGVPTVTAHPVRAIDPATSVLLLIDFQARLMPAIADGEAAVANAVRLARAAHLLSIPVLGTEQNPSGLGPNVASVRELCSDTFAKTTFDATREHDFFAFLPDRPNVVVAGCEAHVCVMQTVLGLLAAGRTVHLVRDAVGSRTSTNRDAAIERLLRHGADAVTTEMVIFDWLGDCRHPAFKTALPIVK